MENTNDTAATAFEGGERSADDLKSMMETVQQRGSEMLEVGKAWVTEHPLAAIGAAFGVGFVLAGGLVSKTTLRVLKLGARLYFRRFVSDLVGKGAQELFGGMDIATGHEAVRS